MKKRDRQRALLKTRALLKQFSEQTNFTTLQLPILVLYLQGTTTKQRYGSPTASTSNTVEEAAEAAAVADCRQTALQRIFEEEHGE